MFIQIKINKKDCIVGVCYRPPNQSTSEKDKFLNCLEEEISRLISTKSFINLFALVGDFNDRCTAWESDHSESELGTSLVNMCNEFNLQQIITQPTREGNLLDLIITNNSCNIVSSGVMDPIDNLDHCPVFANFKIGHYIKKANFKRIIWNFNAENLQRLDTNLSMVPWHALLSAADTVDECVYTFYKILEEELEAEIPSKTVLIRTKDKPGMTCHVRKFFRKVHRLHKRAN